MVSYPGIESSTYANTYVVGEPLTIKKVYHYTGINPETGLYAFTDVDGNGSYSTADRKTIVNLGRNFYGGIENSLQYKGLTFDFFFEYVNQQSQGYYSYFPNAPGQMSNQPQVVLGRWEEPNDASEIQRFTRATSSSYQRLLDSDHNLEGSSFLRLKTVAITYSLPAAFVGKAKLKVASFFIRGQNLFTLTSYRGLDPENGGSIQLPQLMTVTAGINNKL